MEEKQAGPRWDAVGKSLGRFFEHPWVNHGIGAAGAAAGAYEGSQMGLPVESLPGVALGSYFAAAPKSWITAHRAGMASTAPNALSHAYRSVLMDKGKWMATGSGVALLPRVIRGVADAADTSTNTAQQLRASTVATATDPATGVSVNLTQADYDRMRVLQGLHGRAGETPKPAPIPDAKLKSLTEITPVPSIAESLQSGAAGLGTGGQNVGKASENLPKVTEGLTELGPALEGIGQASRGVNAAAGAVGNLSEKLTGVDALAKGIVNLGNRAGKFWNDHPAVQYGAGALGLGVGALGLRKLYKALKGETAEVVPEKLPFSRDEAPEDKKKTRKKAAAMQQIAIQQYAPMGDKRDFTPEEQAKIDEGQSRWMPRIFQSYGTPVHEMMASPGKQALIAGLLGALGGAGSGAFWTGQVAGQQHAPLGAAIGGAGLGGLMALLRYHQQSASNEGLQDIMRRLPPGATKRDYLADSVTQADLDRSNQLQMAAALGAGAMSPKLAAACCPTCGGENCKCALVDNNTSTFAQMPRKRTAKENSFWCLSHKRPRKVCGCEHKPVEKKSASESQLQDLLSLLKALHWNHQTAHWQVQGDDYYGNHLLFERLYGAIPGEWDGLAEKMVAQLGSESVDQQAISDSAKDWTDKWSKTEDNVARALQAEKDLQALLKKILGTELTAGLDNFLQGIADAHEAAIYLLGQIEKGTKKAAADPLPNPRALEDDELAAISKGESQWFPESYVPGMPLTSTMASPWRQAVLAGLAGGTAGSLAGAYAGDKLGRPGLGTVAGGLGAGGVMALLAYLRRHSANRGLVDLMKRTDKRTMRRLQSASGNPRATQQALQDSQKTTGLGDTLSMFKIS